MDMNAAGALHAYARQSAQGLTGSGSQTQSRRLAMSQSRAADSGNPLQLAVAPAQQPLLTSGLDLLA
jgi:hypothetical protein